MLFNASDSVMDVRDLPSRRAIVLVRVVAPLRELLERLRFFKCSEVLPLQVLNQGELNDLGVACQPFDDRNLAETGLHRRMVPALTGDDLQTRPALPDDERFDDALFRDGRDELRQITHNLTRLVRIGVEQVDWH